MRRITIVLMILLLTAGVAFAPPTVEQHKEVWISNETVSDHTAGATRTGDDLEFTDPNAGTIILSRIKQGQVVIVAKKGGDYTTIQAAIDSITDSGPTKPYVVYLMPGVYDEKVDINKSDISLVGMDREKCIISREVTDRFMTVKIYSSDGAIANINIANLTIKNTNVWGGGGQLAQEALAIGHPNAGANAVTNVRVDNCYFYGYQDTTFVYPNCEAVFENCYIYGGFDIACSWKATVKYFNCRLKIAHSSAAGIFYLDECTVHAIGNWLESTQANSKAAKLHHNNDVLYFIGNYMDANLEASPIQFVGGVTPTVYAALNNGYSYIVGVTILNTPAQKIVGNFEVTGFSTFNDDATFNENAKVVKGLNVGTATGAGTGEGKFSGDVDAVSFTIGANALTTTEWAFLDGQDQAVKTSDIPLFSGLNVGADMGAIAGTFWMMRETANEYCPGIRLYKRRSDTAQDGDRAGDVTYIGENDAGEDTFVAELRANITDVSDGQEDGSISAYVMGAGATRTERWRTTHDRFTTYDKLFLQGITADTDTDMLYYNSTSKEVEYGAVCPLLLVEDAASTGGWAVVDRILKWQWGSYGKSYVWLKNWPGKTKFRIFADLEHEIVMVDRVFLATFDRSGHSVTFQVVAPKAGTPSEVTATDNKFWLLEHGDYLEIEFDSNARIDAGRALFVVEGFYERI